MAEEKIMDEELQNLYTLARRAKDEDNTQNAAKYYDTILTKCPLDWEASFYSVYYKEKGGTIKEIPLSSQRVINCTNSVFGLIKDNVKIEDEIRTILSEITKKLIELSLQGTLSAANWYNNISWRVQSNFTQQYINMCFASKNMLSNAGDKIVEVFGDEYGNVAVDCWKINVTKHIAILPKLSNQELNKKTIMEYVEKIQKYDPSYPTPTINTTTSSSSSGGCYVATAVYGSYDCPQVWTLRRYRDYSLAKTWYGRAFVRTYYAISPTLVRWFGETNWFKKMWRGKLDSMVEKLQDEGFESTPYEDKEW